MSTTSPIVVLRHQDLKREKGISWSYSWCLRQEKAGKFPGRIKLGPGTVGWVESEIDAWLAARERTGTVHAG